MPRPGPSRKTKPTERKNTKEENDNYNIDDDLPAVSLTGTKTKNTKSKKKVSYKFPVDVITNSGKFSGTGMVDVIESSNLIEKTLKLMPDGRRGDAVLQKVYDQFEEDLKHLMDKEKIEKLIEEVKPQKKKKTAAEECAAKKKDREAKKKELETKKKEAEAKKRESEGKKKESEAKKKESEAKKKESEANKKESEANKKESEPNKKESEANKKESGPDKKESEAKKRESEGKKKESEPNKKELEPNKKESEANKKESEPNKKESETNKKELEAKRELVKKAIEHEKQAKAYYDVVNKIYNPAECMKFMSLQMHHELAAAWYMESTVTAARRLRLPLATVSSCFEPGLVMWTRRLPPTLQVRDGQMVQTGEWQLSPHYVLVTTVAQAAELTARGQLVQEIASAKQRAPGIRALIVLNTDVNESEAGMARAKVHAKIGDLLLELMVTCNLGLVVAESPDHLAKLIMRYTKAVAEEPYKKSKRKIEECTDFFMRGDNKNCVTVDKEGNGLSGLWQQMIAVLPQSSLEVARSLTAQYTAPAKLMQELQSPDGVARVAELGVSRTNVPGAKSRRLGPEFARKLHTLFTTEDGNTLIE